MPSPQSLKEGPPGLGPARDLRDFGDKLSEDAVSISSSQLKFDGAKGNQVADERSFQSRFCHREDIVRPT